MKNVVCLLAAFAAASALAACGFQHTSSSLLPTSPSTLASTSTAASTPVTTTSPSASSASPAPSASPTPSLLGLWTSQSIAAPSATSCGKFQWSVTSQTTTSVSGTFSAVCASGVTISGTASGQLVHDTTVPITVTGNASLPGFPTCAFSLSGTGTVQDNANTLVVPYTGSTCLGPVSGTETLHRPQPPAPPPPPTPDPVPPPPPPPPVSNDAINLNQVAVYNSPADIASWPVTTKITSLTMQPSGAPLGGVSLTFSAQNTWPNAAPPGFTGGIQYTVWAVVKINGQWNTSGFIEMWQGRPSTGAPILSDFAKNWAYDSRWGPMAGYQPQVGEQMGFFVSAGDARGFSGPTSVRERSNVVVVALPAGDSGTFGF